VSLGLGESSVDLGGGTVTEVLWAATSLESGRFDALVVNTGIGVLNERFVALKERGEGYLEVRRREGHPALTMGFRGSVAVVEAFSDEDSMSILEGDGSVHEESVEVPVMDEDAFFSGHFGVETERAWEVVQAFLQGSELAELGEWSEL
jgi:hypothetical protein